MLPGGGCSETTPLLPVTDGSTTTTVPLPTSTVVAAAADDATSAAGADASMREEADGHHDAPKKTTPRTQHGILLARRSSSMEAPAEPKPTRAASSDQGVSRKKEILVGGCGNDDERAVPQRDAPNASRWLGTAGRGPSHPKHRRRRTEEANRATARQCPLKEGATAAAFQRIGSVALLLRLVVFVSLGMVATTTVRLIGEGCGFGDRFGQFASLLKGLTLLEWDPVASSNLLAEMNRNHDDDDDDDSDHKAYSSRPSRDHPTVKSRPGFPSYLDYASSATSLNVTYDARSFFLNGDRALFLSGSMHPVRSTRATWIQGVNEAVRHHLNMVTLYVMWSAHQPFATSALDFDFMPTRPPFASSHKWSLAEAIRIAASRGLFVHIRVGPYVCAEYSYGGIPEWLPLQFPQMDMRRSHPEWYSAMEMYVTELAQYLSHHKLWAHQGGPIVLAQIENELQGDSDASSSTKLQEYADWCGAMVQRVAPNVVWTMCNGLVAPNAIETLNGDWGSSDWLAQNGFSRRIQVDQPALWTEAEGGFQIWGDDPDHPSDYYWGRTARDVAFQTLKWFARGGAHLNYYMFWGGSNYGRSAAGGIANMYASDAALCSSGERRQPKFDHLTALHDALAETAHVLLNAPTALHQNRSAQVWNGTSWGYFEIENFTVCRYVVAHHHTRHHREAVFVENNSDEDRNVRVRELQNRIVAIKARSSLLFLDGRLRFDSGQLASSSVRYRRKIVRNPVHLKNWSWRIEDGYENYLSFHPVEQTTLMAQARRSSDYAWYSTSFDTLPAFSSVGNLHVDTMNVSGSLTIQTQQANGMVAYLDEIPLGSADTHQHKEGIVTLHIPIPPKLVRRIITSPRQSYTLDMLSDSFGYGNLIGCFGVNNTRAKTKGITGNVDLVLEWRDSEVPEAPIHLSTTRLTDGTFVWGSMAGLNRGPTVFDSPTLDRSGRGSAPAQRKAQWRQRQHQNASDGNSYRIGGMWSSVTFPTPAYNPDRQGLFVDIVWGRGHFWLNGVDLGRYWNVTSSRASSMTTPNVECVPGRTTTAGCYTPFYTQRYYFLPPDLLVDSGSANELNVLEFFDALGWPSPDYFDSRHRPKLVLSWIEPSNDSNHTFDDAVGYQDACLY